MTKTLHSGFFFSRCDKIVLGFYLAVTCEGDLEYGTEGRNVWSGKEMFESLIGIR